MLFCGSVRSEEHFIVGFAPDFIGEEVTLYTYQDYMTMTKIPIGKGSVSSEDSLFRIPLKNNSTIKGIIEIDQYEAFLYLAPNSSYDLYFPKVEGSVSFQNNQSDIVFYGLDTADINYRILQYHQWFDTFVSFHEREISGGLFLEYLDTFKLYAMNAYKGYDDPYFLTYVRYDIASMDQTHGGVSGSEGRLNMFLDYIEPFPVYFENDRYMQFVRDFYHQDFQDYPADIRGMIDSSIMVASPTLLMKTLKSDLFLVDPEMREMMMVVKLGQSYYDYVQAYRKPNVLFMLDSVANHAKYQMSSTIADNVLNYLTNLEQGYPAPYLSVVDDTGAVVNWSRYNGKFVYLNFFTTWDELSKTEMLIIKDIKGRYQEDVAFLSICMDEDSATYVQYREEHADLDWDIVYAGDDEQLKKAFQLKSLPAYHLIDQSGFMAIPHAPRPTADGEYESIDKTLFYIQQALHPVERKRPGQP